MGLVQSVPRLCLLSGRRRRFLFIFAKVLLGLFGVIGPLSISNAYLILPALVVTLAVCVYGLLKIPDLTASILSGRTGTWVNPLGD